MLKKKTNPKSTSRETEARKKTSQVSRRNGKNMGQKHQRGPAQRRGGSIPPLRGCARSPNTQPSSWDPYCAPNATHVPLCTLTHSMCMIAMVGVRFAISQTKKKKYGPWKLHSLAPCPGSRSQEPASSHWLTSPACHMRDVFCRCGCHSCVRATVTNLSTLVVYLNRNFCVV